MPQLRSPTIAAPDPNTRTPRIQFPPGACDCHSHVFGPQARYLFAPNAAYIAPDSPTPSYVRMLKTIGCERAVIVQPSVYGTDNSAMLEALRSGLFAFRGVAVVRPDIGDKELQAMHEAGVRGIRVNLSSATPGMTLDDAKRIAPRLKALGWHIQFFLDIKAMTDVEEKLAALDIDIVIDHFGRVNASEGTQGAAFQRLLGLVRRENCWAKLIGPYFVSTKRPLFDDVAPLARAVVATAPDRVVWGTDWPHPSPHGAMPNDGDLADLLGTWVPDEAQRKRVLVDNAARLYGFSTDESLDAKDAKDAKGLKE
jgi:predicted TIM-barrel fold metal-dependent hydrolase